MGINTKARRIVKSRKGPLLAALGLLLSLEARALPLSATDTDAFPPPVNDSELPNIEARAFESRVLEVAPHGKLVLFEDPSGTAPRVGRILLLRRDDEPILAFRVLRTYPRQRRFIAKQVRAYGNHESVSAGEAFTTLERLNEIGVPAWMGYTTEDQLDLDQLQAGVAGAGAAERLDAGFEGGDFYRSDELRTQTEAPPTAPAPGEEAQLPASENGDPAQAQEPPQPTLAEGGANALDELEESEEAALQRSRQSRRSSSEDNGDFLNSSLELPEEIQPIDRYQSSLSGVFGLLKNRTIDGGAVYYTAAGVRYGLDLGERLFVSSPKVQDSLTLEGGLFAYRVSSYAVENDAYTLIPVSGVIRYTFHTRGSIDLFAYGGILWNIVNAASTPTDLAPEDPTQAQALGKLQGILPALGAGALIKIGPGWEIRADLGLDMIASGLVLRF